MTIVGRETTVGSGGGSRCRTVHQRLQIALRETFICIAERRVHAWVVTAGDRPKRTARPPVVAGRSRHTAVVHRYTQGWLSNSSRVAAPVVGLLGKHIEDRGHHGGRCYSSAPRRRNLEMTPGLTRAGRCSEAAPNYRRRTFACNVARPCFDLRIERCV